MGAPQTIDQVGLFTTATRWACDPGCPQPDRRRPGDPSPPGPRRGKRGPSGPGPVHLNLAFREPLIGDAGRLPPSDPGPVGVAGRTRWPRRLIRDPGSRGIIARRLTRPPMPLSSWLWPSVSVGRCWPILDQAAGFPGTIAAADAILRDAARRCPRPSCFSVHPGFPRPSASSSPKRPRTGARVIAVDPWWQWTDPTASSASSTAATPDMAARRRSSGTGRRPEWLETWQPWRMRPQAPSTAALGNGLNEPLVARLVARAPRDAAPPSSCRPPCRCAISNGSPRRARRRG